MTLKIAKITIVALLILCFATEVSAQSYSSYKFKTIVIDAGHGGRPGAVYGKIFEKDITLAVALNLGKKIKEAFPDVKVIYTRTNDTDVELYRRSQIANDANADLFISIHANSAGARSAAGTETFVMGYDKSQANMEVAMKENQVVTYETDYQQKYEGFDPKSAESYILFSLMQYSYISQSTIFASYIQNEYAASTPMKNRGVKQGPLLVLWRATMPSVLTEIGFLSNEADRRYITSKSGQDKIVSSIFRAFCRYKDHLETGSNSVSIPTTTTTTKKSEPTEYKQPITHIESKTSFEVQISAGSKELAINSRNFGKYANQIKIRKIGNIYKYFVTGCKNYKEALSLQIELRNYKYKDAFIVAYKGDMQVDVTAAIRESR